MATFAALLIPLALLQAASNVNSDVSPSKTSHELDLIATDTILDVVRYWNKFKRSLPPGRKIPGLNEKFKVGNDLTVQIHTTNGVLTNSGVELATKLVTPIKFEQMLPSRPSTDSPRREIIHRVSASIPITFKDMELRYKHLSVTFNVTAESKYASIDKDKPAVHVIVGDNKFVLYTELIHFSGDNAHCEISVGPDTEKFDLKKIEVTGLDALGPEIVKEIANAFKQKLGKKKAYTSDIVAAVADQTLPGILEYCKYVEYDAWQRILTREHNRHGFS